MASEWQETTLGEFVRLQRGHDLTASERRTGNIPVIGSAGVNGYHDTALSQGPGITIGRSGVGSMGVVTYVPTDYWPHNTVLYVTDFLGNDPRFVYYFLHHFDLRRFNSGSAQASLNRNYIYPLPIQIPRPSEQKAIAQILGSMDIKIELNRRMNATLEAMAQALFQSWFVDFDPVKAKAAGRAPEGMDADTAALFPSEFEESELGLIPKGWNVGSVRENFSLTMGQSPPGETYNEKGNGMAFFQGCTDFGFRYPTARVFCTAPTRFAEKGDTLVSVRAPVGEVNMAFERCCIGRGVAAIRHNSKNRLYTFYSVRKLENHFSHFEAEGTVFGSINKSGFQSLTTIEPPSEIITLFERLVTPLDSKVESNTIEIKFLTDFRDSLLPRLISGQLRIPEAERLAEAAV